MSAAERAYRLLLAYPRDFRAGFGEEMVLAFRSMHREAGGFSARQWLWLRLVLDVARSAPSLRAAAWRERAHTSTGEAMMKAMAILAVLVGAVQVGNGFFELWAGGVARGDGVSLAAGLLVIVASLALLGAGVALLRDARGATTWANGAAGLGLLLFLVVAVALPRMSIFSLALGFAFPVALIVALRLGGGRPPAVATH